MKGETRKIQFTGNSSYIVSLPKVWVEEMGLGRGDEVVISQHGSSSMLLSLPRERTAGQDGSTGREVTVSVKKGDPNAVTIRKIISLYLQGYTMIHITWAGAPFGASQRAAIKDALRHTLVGAEITSDSSRGITVQILVDTLALSVSGAFKRMLHLSKSMLSDAITAVKENDADLAKDVINSDDEVDRFGFYIIRQLKIAVGDDEVLRELGIENARNCLDYRLVVKSIERSGDHAVAIARILLESDRKIGGQAASKLQTMAEYASSTLDDACLALFTKDYELAEKTVGTRELGRLEKSVLEAAQKSKAEEGYMTRRIAEDVRRIAEYASDIAEVVLNMNIERASLGTAQGRP